MIEVHTWIFVVMISGLILGGVALDIQHKQIKKLQKEIKKREQLTHPG
jgi:hypothetical protein